MPIQGLKYNILSNTEQHKSYQATGSFTAYNPNDGVAFIATDRTATSLDWDYKLPSQSGGSFPGPINSYLSIYYLDQSGTGAPSAIVVYASPQNIDIPYFWSIGRALQSVGSSLDIQQGSQPGNPGTGITRVWADGTGNLHILLPTGTDKVVIDSGNIGSQSLGGDLYGTIGAGHVRLVNGAPGIQAYDNGGTARTLVWVNGNATIYINAGGGVTYWQNQAQTLNLMSMDNAGNLNLTGGSFAINPGSLTVSSSGNAIIGTVAFGGTNGRLVVGSTSSTINDANPFMDQAEIQNNGTGASKIGFHRTGVYAAYLGLDTDNVFKVGGWSMGAGAWRIVLGDNFSNGSGITCGGPFVYTTVGYAIELVNANNSLYWDNSTLCQLACVGANPIFRHYGPSIGSYFDFQIISASTVALGGTVLTWKIQHLTGPNDSAAPMQSWILGTSSAGSANVYCPATSIPSLRAGKRDLQILDDQSCLKLVVNPGMHAWTFLADPTEKKGKQATEEDPEWPVLHTANGRNMGLVVDEVIKVVPEVVATADGDPFGLNYQLLVAALWGAVRELERRVKILEPV